MDNVNLNYDTSHDRIPDQEGQSTAGARTPLGSLTMSFQGSLFILLGFAAFLPGILFLPNALPLLVPFAALGWIMGGFRISQSRRRKCSCPFCGDEGVLKGDAWKYKCLNCLEVSTKKNGYLEPYNDTNLEDPDWT